MDVTKINFKNKDTELFSEIAKEAARSIKSQKDKNKQTQLRKFYDELEMWNAKIQHNKESYTDNVVYIKMLKAKVAYAEGRKHVTHEFSEVFNRCIDQINDVETLKDAKLFMEAVMGYGKYYEEMKK